MQDEKAAAENINGLTICMGKHTGMEHMKMDVLLTAMQVCFGFSIIYDKFDVIDPYRRTHMYLQAIEKTNWLYGQIFMV